MLKPLLERWRLCAVLIAAGMLATAHAFETFGGLAPCTLCLRQREVYWAILTLGLIAMIVVRMPGGPRWRGLTCWGLAALFVLSCAVAAYHAGAEWKFWPGPQACASGGGGVSAADMAAFLDGAKVKAPACDEAPWVLAGLSMAGWNAVLSLVFAGLSIAAAIRERGKLYWKSRSHLAPVEAPSGRGWPKSCAWTTPVNWRPSRSIVVNALYWEA
jgi:disulfide bond formation protein DsbB